jgi:hypothetical protein
MARYHFDVRENGTLIEDEEGHEFDDQDEVRREAVEAGASIARDAFVSGSARRVVVNVRREDIPFFRVSISLDVESAPEAGDAVQPHGLKT